VVKGNAEPPQSAPPLTSKATGTRVAVPAMNNDGLHSTMDSRFGRAPWFVVVEMESGEVVDTLVNDSAVNSHGAGTGAASLMARSGVDAVIAGRFGPKAQQALKALGIGLWTSGGRLTVEQAVVRLRSGELSRTA
jgi:predicted Fe-Mo cluster-binding NifX family protein